MYLCPGGLTCCINGKIAAPQPRLNLPVQSLSDPPDDASLTSQDSSSSNDNLWAFDDDSQSDDTASLFTDPSNNEAYNTFFLDRIDSDSNSNSDSDFTDLNNNDWVSSIFNDPNEEAKYFTQEQPSDFSEEDAFTMDATAAPAIGSSNLYPNGPSIELASMFDDDDNDANEGATDFAIIPDQSLG